MKFERRRERRKKDGKQVRKKEKERKKIPPPPTSSRAALSMQTITFVFSKLRRVPVASDGRKLGSGLGGVREKKIIYSQTPARNNNCSDFDNDAVWNSWHFGSRLVRQIVFSVVFYCNFHQRFSFLHFKERQGARERGGSLAQDCSAMHRGRERERKKPPSKLTQKMSLFSNL